MLTPYVFQNKAIQMGRANNLLCADACGLGKTLTAIEIAKGIQRVKPFPILVVCRKGAKLQWSYAIEEQIRPYSNAHINIVDSTFDYEYAMEGNDTDTWFIIHLEALRKLEPNDALARTYFSTVILDEAHRIKGRKSQQTLGAKKLVAYRKIALTATPMERGPGDMWSALNWLYPGHFRGYHGFAAKFHKTVKNPYTGFNEMGSPQNMPLLAKILRGVYVQRTKEEVRPDMPPLTESRIPVTMHPKVRDIDYKIKSAGDILVDIGEREDLVVPNTLSAIMHRRQLTSNGWLRYPSTKMDWVKNYVKDNPREKILVFSVFRDTAIELARVLKAPRIIGGERRPDIVGDKSPLVVGTIKALGESYDLPWIDTAIFVDVEWSTIEMTQARNRIHRINITSPKQAIYLYHPGTVDDLVFKALDGKWKDLRIVQEYLSRYA